MHRVASTLILYRCLQTVTRLLPALLTCVDAVSSGKAPEAFCCAMASASFVVGVFFRVPRELFIAGVLPSLLEWLHLASIPRSAKAHTVRTLVRTRSCAG
jgi:hypothetical protein